MRPHLVVRKRIYEFGHVHRDPGRDAWSFASSVGERRHDGGDNLTRCSWGLGPIQTRFFLPSHVFSRQLAPWPRCLTPSKGALLVFTGLRYRCVYYTPVPASFPSPALSSGPFHSSSQQLYDVPEGNRAHGQAKEGGRGVGFFCGPPLDLRHSCA